MKLRSIEDCFPGDEPEIRDVRSGLKIGLYAGFAATAIAVGTYTYHALMGDMPDPQLWDKAIVIGKSALAGGAAGCLGTLAGGSLGVVTAVFKNAGKFLKYPQKATV